MAAPLVRQETPTEFFRELVETTIRRQHVEAGELTSFYLVNLLAGFVRVDRTSVLGDPLGIRLLRAMQAEGVHQHHELRQVGDLSLFISGFFGDSLNRRLVDVDYYIQLGERAYGALARQEDDAFSDVFDDLAANFVGFVDVFGEISERTALTSNQDLLRLYERWVRTRSPRSEELLASRGIVPNRAAASRFVQ